MKTLITALGLGFIFATVAPAIGSLPFATTPAFAHDNNDYTTGDDAADRDTSGHDTGGHDAGGHDSGGHDSGDR
jgi:hypothetical protein